MERAENYHADNRFIIGFCVAKMENREKETETKKGDRIDDQTRKFNL